MPNVKPGDLCIILGTSVTPNLNGRIVEVISPAKTGDTFQRVDTNLVVVYMKEGTTKSWEVSSKESLPWKLVSGTIGLFNTRPVGDRFLFKIKDKDVDIETETAKELELEKV